MTKTAGQDSTQGNKSLGQTLNFCALPLLAYKYEREKTDRALYFKSDCWYSKKLLWSSLTKIEHVMTATRNSKDRMDQGAFQWARVEASNATVTNNLMGKMFITWHVQQKYTGGRQRRGQKAICKYLCMILRNYFESWMRKTAHFQQLRNRCKGLRTVV